MGKNTRSRFFMFFQKKKKFISFILKKIRWLEIVYIILFDVAFLIIF